jgi:hypothetical protein
LEFIEGAASNNNWTAKTEWHHLAELLENRDQVQHCFQKPKYGPAAATLKISREQRFHSSGGDSSIARSNGGITL